MLSNKDVDSALTTIYNNLDTDGILCFDFIDANRFFKKIKGGKNIIHKALCDDKKYQRDSYIKTNTSNNFMFDWHSKYYEIKGHDKILIAEDDSEVRAFTKNEWEILLHLNNFKLLEFIDKTSYAFDTYVVVAQKTHEE
jgi:hypothetical protein